MFWFNSAKISPPVSTACSRRRRAARRTSRSIASSRCTTTRSSTRRSTASRAERKPSATRGRLRIHQVNLQTIAGGGKFYTRSLTRALLDLGHEVTLYVHPENRFWDAYESGRVTIVHASDEAALAKLIPAQGQTIVVHTKVSEDTAKRLAAGNRL